MRTAQPGNGHPRLAGRMTHAARSTKSTDGGATWSAPVTLNDDATANDQFHPSLGVAGNAVGGDTVTCNRRDDAAACRAHVPLSRVADEAAALPTCTWGSSKLAWVSSDQM